MNTMTMNEKIKHPRIDTVIRDILTQKYGFDESQAEGIAIAIDMKETDLSGYATKGDILEVKNEIKLAVSEITSTIYKVQFGAMLATTGLIMGILKIIGVV